MEILKFKLIIILAFMLLSMLAWTACKNFVGTNEQAETQEEKIAETTTNKSFSGQNEALKEPSDANVFFNPQQELSARMFEFETTGLPERDWEGRFRSADFSGLITVKTLSSVQRGRTLYLMQLWTLHPPEPVSPVTMTLKGGLNFTKGTIVMNGLVETDGTMIKDGTRIHVRGQFAAKEEGAISVGGELMFNPQPEPPARNTLTREHKIKLQEIY